MRHPTVAAAALAFLAGPAHAALTISASPTSNMSCAGGVCTATGYSAVLNVGDLQTMLASGNITVVASKAKSIVIAAPLSWTGTSTLELDVRATLIIAQPVSVLGAGGLAFRTTEPNAISYTNGANIAFWDNTSTFSVNNIPYKLVSDIASLAANAGGNVALARSYDAGPDGTYAQAPVAVLNGSFEGLGNTISNLTVTDAGSQRMVGLVGVLAFGAAIAHLNLVNAHVTGGDNSQVGGLVGSNGGTLDADTVSGSVASGAATGSQIAPAGGLAGSNDSNAEIDASSSTADVSGGTGAFVGGLVGYSLSYINTSHASGTVTGAGDANATAGGLVGSQSMGVITASYASGAVSGGRYGGGLVGYSGGASASQSYATGAVMGAAGSSIGGLYGFVGNDIEECFSTGSVTLTGAGNAGGLAGENPGRISESYSSSAVTGVGTSNVGGLAGLNNGQITYSYAAGNVAGTTRHKTGGLIGFNTAQSGSFLHAYWDLGTTGIKDPSRGAGNEANESGITGLANTALKTSLPAGFDTPPWALHHGINDGLPYLAGVTPH
jgi:hypothetical protein